MSVDVDRLPPTQYLILEILAARYRLGEHTWSFPSRLGAAGEALAALGLIVWTSHPAPDARRAWLTDAGKAAMLTGDYQPPDVVRQRDKAQDQLARIVRAGERWGGPHNDEIIRILTDRDEEHL
ncbi:hypothetical protein ACFFX1_55430 [Dactylosporangium sucinum]|uniref:Uncharacterized protein n=1 Tax=Dactylosporangium sucinum TaxID=1424081 RepID=A0A917X1F0_9ACTN|nr:hypothetical protein [Dactylosporangium sucinum]GGM52651.1 hypothetical protein GCM10007977_062780 [Dactylosporangium sucinum]